MDCRRPQFDSWVGKIHWRRDRLPTQVLLGFPFGSAGKESTCNVRDLGLIHGLGRSLGEGKRYPLQYSGLEISMNCIVHGVAKSWTLLSDFHFHFPAVCSTVGMLDHTVALFLVFSGTSILFSIVTVQCTFSPTLWMEGFPFLYTLSSMYSL